MVKINTYTTFALPNKYLTLNSVLQIGLMHLNSILNVTAKSLNFNPISCEKSLACFNYFIFVFKFYTGQTF